MAATEDDLLEIFANEALVERSTLKRDATLDALGIESLDLISVMFEIENKYGLVLEEGDLPQDATLGDVLDFILSRLNAAAPSHA